MTIPDEFPPEKEIDHQPIQDEFATGDTNRIRLLALRLVRRLFNPPHFPSELVWFLMAIIAANIGLELLSQPDEYWLDVGKSTSYTFLLLPSSLGFLTIGIQLGYMLLIGLLLSLINTWAAFVIWLGLSLYHLVSITDLFRCGTVYYFFFESSGNCSDCHATVIALAGLIWGIGFMTAAGKGLIPWPAFEEKTPSAPASWEKVLKVSSIALILVMAAAVTVAAASVPRPYWQQVISGSVPAARTEAALAYDTKRSVAVLFGGTNAWAQSTGWNTINDTWEWNGSEWNQARPENSPSPRLAAGMAFDEERGVIVLFGGSGQDPANQKVFMGDTWEWDGGDWVNVSPSFSPPPRESASMFFDPLRQTVVMYGGFFFDQETQTNVFLEDVWEWDGTSWRRIEFEQPRRSSSAAIVYDPLHQLPLLMDGEGLWSMQGGIWVQPNTFNNPPGRWGSELVFDPEHQQVVLFGGYEGQEIFGDTWTYDGQSWHEVVTEVQPPRRNGHTMFFDQLRGSVLLFGGLEGGTFYNDMWELVQP